MNRKQRRAAVATPPSNFVDLFNAALKLHEAGALDDAEKLYKQLVRMNPKHGLLHNNMGVLYYAQGKVEEAIEYQKKAIAFDPGLGIAYNNYGVSLNKLERHEEAIPLFQRAIEIEPDNSRALNNLGDSLTKSGRFDESIPNLEKALALDPVYAEAKSNMGMALWGKGDIEGAKTWLRASLALQPSLAPVHKNLGLVLLLNGDFGEGWVEYNYRLAADQVPMKGGKLPIWRGQPLENGGAVYLFSEQGVGDEILYSSMLPDLIEKNVNVVWDTDERLVSIIQRSFPGIRVLPRQTQIGSPAPDVVAQLPVGTLGQIFRPSYAHFPRERRSYLLPDKERSAALRGRLGIAPGVKLIGMSWVSKNQAFGRHKSTTLEDWAGIMATPGVRFVDLQYGDTSQEREAFRQKFGDSLAHVDGLNLRDDMEGMFALTAACDHVITVSNTTAHVAGALGIPTWVLVPAGGGKLWYWGTPDKTWTPWYPGIEIIRQVKHGEWDSTLRLATTRLQELLAAAA